MPKIDAYSSIEGLSGLREIYDEISRETSAFAEAAVLACPAACGKCCNTPSENIEATIFEMIIPAIELWEKGDAEKILEELESPEQEDTCVFYVPQTAHDEGRCSNYDHRGITCRLFGFAGCLDKYGKIRFSLCAKLKSESTQKEAEVRDSIGKGLTVPIFSAYRQRVFGLNPLLAEKLYPINTALNLALQKIGFYYCLDGDRRLR